MSVSPRARVRRLFLPFLIGAAALGAAPREDRVDIRVDTASVIAPINPIWAWFGNDEPNYAYMPDGKKLLSELAGLSPVPVFFRTHNLLTSGDGSAALKWGSCATSSSTRCAG